MIKQSFAQNDDNVSTPAMRSAALFKSTLAAAQQGDVDAQLKLARMYYHGLAGLARDLSQAFKWFQAAEKQGSAEASAQVGFCYAYGMGVEEDPARGKEILENGANAGNALAQRYLARLYLDGVGGQQDTSKAFALFTSAAQAGDVPAQVSLARMHMRGYKMSNGKVSNTPENPDYSSAIQLYTNAAASGNPVAEYDLGKMYEAGLGVAKNEEVAVQYYLQSGHGGYGPAELAMGQWHEKQIPTAGWHIINAYAWYVLAAKTGNGVASNSASTLLQKMTPDQIAKALALLSKYQPSSNNLADTTNGSSE